MQYEIIIIIIVIIVSLSIDTHSIIYILLSYSVWDQVH